MEIQGKDPNATGQARAQGVFDSAYDAPGFDRGETLKAQYLEAEALRIVNMKNDP
jgi:hypothetical protein